MVGEWVVWGGMHIWWVSGGWVSGWVVWWGGYEYIN